MGSPPDAPSVRLDETLDDRQPETDPSLCVLALGLPVPIEHVGEVRGEEPGALVAHEDDHVLLAEASAHLDAASGRDEFHRIADQVGSTCTIRPRSHRMRTPESSPKLARSAMPCSAASPVKRSVAAATTSAAS